MKSLMCILPFVTALPWLVACGGAQETPQGRAIEDTGFLADELNDITAVSFQGLRDGETLYRHTCGYCHEYGVGPVILGRDLSVEGTAYITRNGLNSMPAFRETDLSDEEVAAVADYVARTDVFEGYDK